MKLVILDRDGVINFDSDAYIKSPEEWQAIPGSLEAIAKLNKQGYKVAIATNQSGLARNYFSLETLTAIHRKLSEELAKLGGHIDKIVYCPHHPDEDCLCRKPKAGLLYEIAAHFAISLENVPVIGDSLKDLQAAQQVKARPILVLTGNGAKTLQQLPEDNKIPVFDNLALAVETLIQGKF